MSGETGSAVHAMTREEYFDWRRRNGFKDRAWPYAVTVHTPLKKLDWYAPTLLEPVETVREAVIHVTEVVFEPKALVEYRERNGVNAELHETPALLVSRVDDLKRLLVAALSDWVDFGMYVVPARIALAADHDEWTRIFATKKSVLNRIVARLEEGGVEVIEPVHRLGEMPKRGPRI